MGNLIEIWAPMVGHWTNRGNGSVVYTAPQTGHRPYGLNISGVRFSEGEVGAEFHKSSGSVDGRIVLGFRSVTDQYYAIGLGGYGDAYTLTHFFNGAWRKVVGYGQDANLQVGKKYSLLVKVEKTNIKLDIDGVTAIDCDLPAPIPYGQLGLFAWGDSGEAAFTNVVVDKHSSDVDDVVILVHGIRTYASWEAMLQQEFSKVGVAVVPTNYGYLDLFRFLMPFKRYRKKAIDRVWTLVREARQDYPRARLSFLAHSFGTYVVAHILKREFDFKAHRIVFCGSVVPFDFPFEQFRSRFSPPILNEVSARDPWPGFAKNLAFGYGAVGMRGFNRIGIKDRWHKGFGHSRYLELDFCRKFWIPFFSQGTVVEGDAVPERAPFWLMLTNLFLRKSVVAALVAFTLAVWFLFVR